MKVELESWQLFALAFVISSTGQNDTMTSMFGVFMFLAAALRVRETIDTYYKNQPKKEAK